MTTKFNQNKKKQPQSLMLNEWVAKIKWIWEKTATMQKKFQLKCRRITKKEINIKNNF